MGCNITDRNINISVITFQDTNLKFFCENDHQYKKLAQITKKWEQQLG